MRRSEDSESIPGDQAYWSIVERMLDGFYRCKLDGVIVRISPRAIRIVGYDSADELVGKVSMDALWVYPNERDLLLAELREHGEVRGFEATLKTRDGGRVRVELTAVPWYGENGELLGTDGIVRDVTAHSRSEQQFRSLIRNSPGAIFRFVGGEQRRYTFMSDAVEGITGYPPEYFTSSTNPMVRIVHPEDGDLAEALTAVRVESGEHYSFEFRILTPASETRWIQLQGSGATDRTTGVDVVDGVIIDVTDLHQAHEAVERSEATFRHLFESMVEGYWVVDAEGRVKLCNSAAARILGYPDENALIDVDTHASMVDDEQRNAFLGELATNRLAEGVEVDVRRYDGEVVTLSFSTRWTGEGDQLQAESTFRDVTRQKQIEAEIREARHAAEQANRAKSTFLANMSHELRTPLNAILGYSEMLMEEAENAGDSDTADDLRKIHRSGAHLLTLINDVLDLAKVESGKMEALPEVFEVARLLDDVTSTAAPLMAKNANQLRVERGNAPLGTAHQDSTKLRQSLLNLLSNAAKFTHEGTVTLEAVREIIDGTDWLTFSVHDSGIGIAEDKFDQVFKEFGQAEESTTREYGGTGLGLPISRRFCRMLGGDLSLESRLGHGSTFTIRVPAVLVGSEGDAPTEATPERSDAEIAAIREASEGRTVLVIDDDPEARDIVERLVRGDGFEVVTAATGGEGLRLAHAIRPAVITLDVMMPDLDGWTVLRALKADPGLRNVPVVMLSILDDKARGYSLGATDYLVKPIDRDALRQVLRRHAGSPSPGCVLVVDDDESVRRTLGHSLVADGWEVLEAENGRMALDRLAAVRPSLILLDLMMPVMDGFDFLVELRARPDWREIPVVVLTAMDLSAEDRRVLSGRVEQIVTKDEWSHEQLARLIHQAARRDDPAA